MQPKQHHSWRPAPPVAGRQRIGADLVAQPSGAGVDHDAHLHRRFELKLPAGLMGQGCACCSSCCPPLRTGGMRWQSLSSPFSCSAASRSVEGCSSQAHPPAHLAHTVDAHDRCCCWVIYLLHHLHQHLGSGAGVNLLHIQAVASGCQCRCKVPPIIPGKETHSCNPPHLGITAPTS